MWCIKEKKQITFVVEVKARSNWIFKHGQDVFVVYATKICLKKKSMTFLAVSNSR